MAQQIIFFKKNKIDFTNAVQTVIASQGDDFTTLALNRSNQTSWQTTSSVDADNTTFEIDLIDERRFDSILLLKHNFAAYNVKYWNGLSFVDFSPAISVSGNSLDDSFHEFTSQLTTRIKLTVLGTIVADSDKILAQFIATEKLGQFEGWPIIQRPTRSRNRKRSRLLSGKVSIKENQGGFSCRLKVDNWKDAADLALVETLFDSNDGFLTWLSGGDEDQFSSVRKGYRLEDIFLMKCKNEHRPEWKRGNYWTGQKINIDLEEVAD